jgi:catechol 2,3-dioxygenase-like lactoylglutathione lyase family enzyme
MEWKRSNPVFPAADVAASIDWYRRILEFEPSVVNPPRRKLDASVFHAQR